jgi:hypothetical protein
MAWQVVDGRKYFYRHRRDGGRSRTVYVGAAGSPAAELAAAADAEHRAAREARAEALRAEEERYATATGPLDELTRLTDLLLKATLTSLGYHRHARGEWRRRRHGRTSSDEGLPARVEGDPGEGEHR